MPKAPLRKRPPRWRAYLAHGGRADCLGEVEAATECEAHFVACEVFGLTADWDRRRVFVRRIEPVRVEADDLHQRHLDDAHRHVAGATAIVERQRDVVAKLESGRLDAFEARRLLVLFEETLALMVAHRNLLIRTDEARDS